LEADIVAAIITGGKYLIGDENRFDIFELSISMDYGVDA
jgi:hypothetical protein